MPIPNNNKIIPAINRYIKFFSKKNLPIFLSRDWHPKKTGHFKKYGGIWPGHCVENTKGAAFHPKLKLPKDPILLYKGMDPKKDSYSVFQAYDESNARFAKILKAMGIEELYIAGLATDYCVKWTSLDALKKGFRVKVLIDAVKGVNLKPDDSEKAIKRVLKRGAKKVTLSKLRTGR